MECRCTAEACATAYPITGTLDAALSEDRQELEGTLATGTGDRITVRMTKQ
jgi:hypothetical protein